MIPHLRVLTWRMQAGVRAQSKPLCQGVLPKKYVPRLIALAGGLGAVFRTVLETMRTLFVWLVDLLLFYTPLGLGKLGESWSAWSFMQAAGCAPALFALSHGDQSYILAGFCQ